MVTLPASEPALVGANMAFIVTEAPGARMVPVEIPFTLTPAPVIPTLETVTLEAPVLVTEVLCVLLVPTFTFPKVRVVAPELRTPGAVTVRVTILLVTVLTALLIVTENCEPLSEFVVAGVV